MSPLTWRVIKLGGSLLDGDDLAARLRRWLSVQPPAANVVIVGGGSIVEQVRAFDRLHSLPPAAAHWLAVRAMSLTATLLAELLPEASLVSSLAQIRGSTQSGLLILDVERFLREDQDGSNPLPCCWDVTSDSIAARVATVLHAQELVLLKSALPAGPPSREAWSRAGYVDAYFARVSSGLGVRAVNLRDDDFPEVQLTA
jgi:5-(aminomethyl)-3-furanmethanol phosphate kinase